MNNNFPIIKQEAQVILDKSDSLIKITNKILKTRSSTITASFLYKPFVQIGHTDTVGSVAFSPDGKTVLSGSGDYTLKLWNINSGKEIRTFEGHTNWVKSVAFSPDGKTVLSGSWEYTLKLWDISTGREIRTFKRRGYSVDEIDNKLFIFEGGDWITITPEGYFDHSKNGRQYLNVLTSSVSAIAIDDVTYNHYYRPKGLFENNCDDNWMERLWSWADENGVCKELVLPREKSNLLQLTTLYIFEPWELDPDDAPLFLNSNLPKEIGCLNNLTELILYIGNISELPNEIGKLNALTKLEIIIDSVWEEDFYRDAGYVIRSIDRLPHEIVYLKNLTSLVIRGIPSLILSYAQKFWIQQLKDNGCEVDIENNISELDEIPY